MQRAEEQLESAITELRLKIETERKVKEGAEGLLKALHDTDSIETCASNLREADKRLGFFLAEMMSLQQHRFALTQQPLDHDIRQLSLSKLSGNDNEMSMEQRQQIHSAFSKGNESNHSISRLSASHQNPSDSLASLKSTPKMQKKSKLGGLFKGFSFSVGKNEQDPKADELKTGSKSNLFLPPDVVVQSAATSVFGYICSSSSINREKVDHFVHEIVRKLEIEEEVKEGAQKMIEAITLHNLNEKQKDAKVELTRKINDCVEKAFILEKAMAQYNSLVLEKTSLIDLHPLESLRKEKTGRLLININSMSSIIGKKSTKSELYVIVRIDNTPKASTKKSKAIWNEDIILDLEKDKEAEISVHEYEGGMLGLIWFQISDFIKHAEVNGPPNEHGIKKFEGWIDLVPFGKLRVSIEFKEETTKKKMELQRQSAVKKFFLKQGHKFSPIYSYKILRCAVCRELLVSGQGLTCQMCDFTCHSRCQENVVPKCISITSNEMTEKDFLVNHQIPHRFIKSTSVGVHWCGHCGKMVPLSKVGHVKCSECSLVAHEHCSGRIPDLCGLPDGFLDQMRSFSAEKINSGKSNDVAPADTTPVPPVSTAPKRLGSFGNLLSLSSSNLHSSGLSTSHHNALLNSKPYGSQSKLNPKKQGIFDDGKGQSQAGVPTLAPLATSQPSVAPSTMSAPVPQKKRDESLTFFKNGSRGVGLDDFTFLAVLGKGNFGKVMLAQEKFTNLYFAIKVLKKEFILEHDEVDSTKAEKRVFQKASQGSHPFLVNLHSCFQTESRLYFVMEYISGGDLMWHIQHKKFTLSQAHFYACEVLLALQYLHTHLIMYRDLKLDNILLSVKGHVKLADYGLCKENMTHGKKTNTFCGTPEFMAPEILGEKPYGREVDWWSYGVLLFEMLLGKAPFAGDSEQKIFNAVLKTTPTFPSSLHPNAVDVMTKLLNKKPDQRLGASVEDAEEIKKHPYFDGVNWDDVYNLRIPPPYIPSLTGPTDLSNFDDEFTSEMPVLTPVHSILSPSHQEEFRGFTYVSDWAKASRLAAEKMNIQSA